MGTVVSLIELHLCGVFLKGHNIGGGLVEQPFWYSRLEMLLQWPLGDWIPDTHTRFTGTAGRVHCVRIFTHFPCYEPACWSLNFMHFQTSVIRLVDRLT